MGPMGYYYVYLLVCVDVEKSRTFTDHLARFPEKNL